MHDQMGAGNAFINFFDAVDGKNITSGWAAKL